MAGPFVTASDEALYGQSYASQTLTATGTPTGGTFRMAWGRHIATGASVAYNASAATLQTHLRTISEFASCTVSGSAGGPWTVDNSPASHSTPALLYVSDNSLTGGSSPYIAVTATTNVSPTPLIWKIENPSIGSITPLAPKLNVGGEESTMTTQTSEWDIRAPLRLGRHDMQEREDPQVMWDGNAITFIDNQITKPFKQNAPTFSATGEKNVYHYLRFSDTLLKLIYLDGVSYMLSRWTDASDTWQDITDEIVPTTGDRVGWAEYRGTLYVTNAFGYYRLTGWSPGTTIATTNNVAVTAFLVFDQKLIRMEATGQLAYTVSASAAEADWTKPVTAVITDGSSVLAMETFSDQFGALAIYVLTTSGLWIYDWGPALFRKVVNVRANSPSSTTWTNSGKSQLVTHGDSLWAIVDGSVYRYQMNGTVSNVGPWTEQGLPTAGLNFSKRLRAWALWPMNNWLLCAMGTESAMATAPSVGSIGSTPTHLGAVVGWNGQGWYVIQGPQPGIPNRALAVEPVAPPKLFLGSGRYTLFNDAIGNPLYWESQTFQDTGYVITPYFNGSLQHVQHIALMGYAWCWNFTSTEQVIIYYQIDDALDSTSTNTGNDPRKHWKQVVDKDGSALTISSTTLGGQAGLVPFYFDRVTSTDGSTKFSQGQPFYTIRLRMELSGGTAATNTPVVKFVKVLYDTQFPATNDFRVQFQIVPNINGRTAVKQINDFRLLHDLAERQPFALEHDKLRVVKERQNNLANFDSGYVADPASGTPLVISATFSETTTALSET